MVKLLPCLVFLALAAVVAGHTDDEVTSMLLAGLARAESNKYFIYNRNAPRDAVRLEATTAAANAAAAHFRTTTVVLIHDEGATNNSDFNVVLRDALLTADDVSVLALDWAWVGDKENAYFMAQDVASDFAEMIRLYIVARRIDLSRLHIVGFGAGAHIAGFTARELKKKSANYVIARITGLDPTGAPWTNSGASRGLRRTDATYVEVIHSDKAGKGTDAPLADLDFFLNGGTDQPGCGAAGKEGEEEEPEDVCGHERAWEVFAASLSHDVSGNRCRGEKPDKEQCQGFPVPVGNNDLQKFGNGLFYVDAPSPMFPYTKGECVALCDQEK